MRSIPPGPKPKKKMLSYATLLVNEPLATRPQEKSANAPSAIAPSTMLTRDKGFFTTLNDAMADSPANRKTIEDNAP